MAKKNITWYRKLFQTQFMERMIQLSREPGKMEFYKVEELTGDYPEIGFSTIIFRAKNKYELWLKVNDFEDYNTNKKHSNILWNDFKYNLGCDEDLYDYNNKSENEIVEHLIEFEMNIREYKIYNEFELHWYKIELVI